MGCPTLHLSWAPRVDQSSGEWYSDCMKQGVAVLSLIALSCASPQVPRGAAPEPARQNGADPLLIESGGGSPSTKERVAIGQGFRCEINGTTGVCVSTGMAPTCPGEPAQKGLAQVEGVVAVGAGERHACFVSGTGTLLCAGKNDEGELGDGTTQCRWQPAEVQGLAAVKQVAVGNRLTCALHGSGSVSCWGGMGRKPTATRPVVVTGINDAIQIAAGFFQACAVRANGSLWCWGFEHHPWEVPGLSQVVQVAVGSHTCALRRDGTVWCWGVNANGQAGVAGERDVPAAVPGVSDIVQLAVGPYHSCARKRDGGVMCWGDVPSGDEESLSQARNVTEVSGAVFLAAGYDGSCAVLGDGVVKCW